MMPKPGGEPLSLVEAPPKVLALRRRHDRAKALVLSSVERLVRRGFAERHMRDNGDIELHLRSGEIFLLGDRDVTRLR